MITKEIASSWNGKDHFLYKNHVAMQSSVAIEIFEHFFEYNKFNLIIEIGTAGGGWTIFLKEEADKMGAQFITYDKQNFPPKGLEFVHANIDFRLKDVFEHRNEIIELISGQEKVALFCDGGDKISEFEIFSPHLKQGDFIFAHDYAPSYSEFTNGMREEVWGWCEISDEYIADAFRNNNFVKYEPEFFLKSAWMAATKI